jgi:hypothetical protein
MHIIKNESTLDRFVRVLLAEIFFLLAFFWLSGIVALISYGIALLLVVTAGTGFCTLYRMFGIDTKKKWHAPTSKLTKGILIFLVVFIAGVGSYTSIFFTKKFFLEDYNKMNAYYKQTLFYTGQNKRVEAQENYTQLVSEYAIFSKTYQTYRPFVIAGDTRFTADLAKVSTIITGLQDTIVTGDLKSVHGELEQVRPVFQDMLKRNGFSMLAISLIDFHDAMEKIITASDARDSVGVIAVYPEVNEKLKAVEEVANDAEIQAIRQNLEDILALAQNNQSEALSAKATELKSAFVKVYLKRG